jgi:homoserine kinase
MRKVRVRIPATTANLGPGFDTLGIALNLYNEVALEEISDGLVIEIEGEGGKSLPRDERSIVYKAAEKVFDLSKTEISGLRIELINRIPLARGLGSSAAAYLGGLVAANKLCDDKFSEEEIIKFAVEIEGHPDNVVPAFFGGFAISVLEELYPKG